MSAAKLLCPACGNDGVTTTTAPRASFPSGLDENAAVCSCGWRGVTDHAKRAARCLAYEDALNYIVHVARMPAPGVPAMNEVLRLAAKALEEARHAG